MNYSENTSSYYISSNLYRGVRSSDTINKTTKRLHRTLWGAIKDPRNEEFYNKKPKITGLDAYFLPEKFEDQNLSHLDGLLWNSREYIRADKNWNLMVSNKGFAKLNYILNMAAKHSRNHGLGFSFFRNKLGKWCSVEKDEKSDKSKVYFNIQNIEQYQEFIRTLVEEEQVGDISSHDEKKNFLNNERKWIFLKNLICFADLEKDDIYQNRRSLFQYITTDVFWKFFNYDIPINVETKTDTKEHNHKINTSFSTILNGEKINISLLGNIKSQQSLIDKQRRDTNYSASNAINDMIRYQIVVGNHQQLIKVLHQFIKYYQKNPEHIFAHDGELKQLRIKDKGIVNSPYPEYRDRISDLKDDDAGKFIARILDEKNLALEDGYKDIKLIIPMDMRGKLFNVELKFVLSDWEQTNEKGLYRHEVFKLIEKIKLKSRDQKFVLKSWIKKECETLVEDVPQLHEEVSKWHNHDTVSKIYDHIMKEMQPIHIPWIPANETVIHRKIYRNFKDSNYFPSDMEVS